MVRLSNERTKRSAASIDEYRPTVDDTDAVEVLSVADYVLRRRDDVLRAVAVASVGFDGKAVLGCVDARDGCGHLLAACLDRLFFEEVE